MSDSLHEWWLTLHAWWQELTPDSQVFLRGVAVLFGAFLAMRVKMQAEPASAENL